MPALAKIQNYTAQPFASLSSGDAEAQKVQRNFEVVHEHWAERKLPVEALEAWSKNAEAIIEIDKAVQTMHQVLSGEYGYATLSYLAGTIKFDLERTRMLLQIYNKLFRKSLLSGKDGDEVYLLNRPLSSLLDVWRTFCQINSEKS